MYFKLNIHTFAISGHLGRDETIEKISARFYWRPNMADDMKDFFSPKVKDQHTNA